MYVAVSVVKINACSRVTRVSSRKTKIGRRGPDMAEAERFEPPDRFGTLAFKVGDGVTDEVRRRPCHSAEAPGAAREGVEELQG